MGDTGLEPVTPCVSCKCASQLRQSPGLWCDTSGLSLAEPAASRVIMIAGSVRITSGDFGWIRRRRGALLIGDRAGGLVDFKHGGQDNADRLFDRAVEHAGQE